MCVNMCTCVHYKSTSTLLRTLIIYIYIHFSHCFSFNSHQSIYTSFHPLPNTAISDFFLLGIHIRPDSTRSELDFLDDVYYQASTFFNTDSAIIMGDLNADCSYLSDSAYENLDLVKDNKFHWMIGGNEDTTTKDSTCAYDRWIMCVCHVSVCVACEKVRKRIRKIRILDIFI